MDQHWILLFLCFTLLMMTASQICIESNKLPSCEDSAGCVCRSSGCISRENLCPGQQNLTIIEPMFGRIPSYAFENYKSLRNLEISGGIVNSVSAKAFWGLSDLNALSLRDNFIHHISNQTLEDLNSLRQLDLSGNIIDNLDNSIFSGIKNIRVLNLDRNLLDYIMKSTFTGCHMLQFLFLTGNSISAIESGAFSDLQNLQELHLEENYIASITPTTFSGLTSLRYLNLNGNFIQGFVPGSLDSMNMLRIIDLSQNQIPLIATNTFGSSLRNLKKIFLNENMIERIDDGTFKNLTSLETLLLSSNRLNSWSFLDFSKPSNLRELFLSKNKISEMLFPTYSSEPQFPKLQYLDASYNLLSTFPAFFMKDAPLLGQPEAADKNIPTKFNLTENPLVCDCDYSLLNNFVAQLEIACIENTTVECSNASLNISPNQDTKAGVYCQVLGGPLPEIIWKDTNGRDIIGYYNVSGRVSWLPADVMNVDDYMCMIYYGETERQETDLTVTDSSSYTLPSFMEIITVFTMLYITK